jgi:pyrimidine operon attenuation protein/uracil phosphoribosyltransferase
MQILNAEKSARKVQRLAIEILENNYNEKEIVLVGINDNGLALAGMLSRHIEAMNASISLRLVTLRLSPAAPLREGIALGVPPQELVGKAVVVVDDVANTGRTLFYAFTPLMAVLCKKVEVAVLVDRQHKSFPVKPDYVGLSLATTLQEHILVKINPDGLIEAFLE